MKRFSDPLQILLILLFCPAFLSAQIKHAFGFNSTPVFAGFESSNGSEKWSHTISTRIKRSGTGSVRFELNKTDARSPSGSMRAELTPDNVLGRGIQDSTLRWWQYFTYFPEGGWDSDSAKDIFSQWHENSTRCSTSPPLAFETSNGNIYLTVRYNLSSPSYCDNLKANCRMTWLVGPVLFNVWTKWTVYYQPAIHSEGRILVYKDGQLVIRLDGPNDMNGTTPHYWKFGIYKWPWAEPEYGRSTTSTRIIYFDDLLIGNKDATLANFEPSADSMVLAEGANISLDKSAQSAELYGPVSTGGFKPTYLWELVSGPVTPEFLNQSSVNATVTKLTAAGNYLIRLTISNDSTVNYSYFKLTKPNADQKD